MRVAAYAVMKNEAENAREWLDSVAEADVIVVLDTGSVDGTDEILREHYAEKIWNGGPTALIVANGHISPWRFDVGLNSALALVPPDVDVCLNLAADERVTGGWRDALARAAEVSIGGVQHGMNSAGYPNKVKAPVKFMYPYEFAPTLTFNHDRCHTREGYAWRYPFHEACYPARPADERRVFVADMKITQKQNLTVNRMERDLALAELALREFPQDARMAFYVGRQFMYAGQYRRALEQLNRYAGLARRDGHEFALEQQWVAEAIAQCWQQIGAGRG